MEKNFSVGVIVLEVYKKPAIGCRDFLNGIFPAAIMPIVGLSAKALAVVGAAAGLAAGLASGDNRIDSTHTKILAARKNFVLE